MLSSFHPKVSIIIPVYNGSNFLRESIDSALSQTYKNIEILVINDGSKDDGATEKIALSFGDKIIYISKENGWVASALNLGIREMIWEYFSWLSHDDLYLPSKIEKQIDSLSNLSNKNTIISSDYIIVNEKQESLSEMKLDYTSENLPYKLLMNWFINGCTLLIPKAVFDDVWVFEDTLKTTQDYHLWFRMMKKYKFINIPEFLVKSRQHWEQDSRKKMHIAIQERGKLENFVFQIYSLQELKESAGSNLPDWLFYFVTRLKLSKYPVLSFLALVADKIGIHSFLAKIYRKIFQ